MNLKAETCVCGSNEWHTMVGDVIWCRRCGSVRQSVYEVDWNIPLDRSGEVANTGIRRQQLQKEVDETPTKPGTPKSKSGEWKKT
jgi:hypothetical protein